jgi:hypothetical protein
VPGAPAGDAEVVSLANGDTGNTFRYSATDDLYIYNLSTKPASFRAPYTYQVVATLDDGSSYAVELALKK